MPHDHLGRQQVAARGPGDTLHAFLQHDHGKCCRFVGRLHDNGQNVISCRNTFYSVESRNGDVVRDAQAPRRNATGAEPAALGPGNHLGWECRSIGV